MQNFDFRSLTASSAVISFKTGNKSVPCLLRTDKKTSSTIISWRMDNLATENDGDEQSIKRS